LGIIGYINEENAISNKITNEKFVAFFNADKIKSYEKLFYDSFSLIILSAMLLPM
jgi:hypothetical protein